MTLWTMRLYVGTDFAEGLDGAYNDCRADVSRSGNLPSRSTVQRRHILVDIFGKPPDRQHVREVFWRDHCISWGTLCEHDSLLVQEILWDLHQLSFQFDLLAIDRYLATKSWVSDASARYGLINKVFGGREAMFVEPRPTQSFGLASESAEERREAHAALLLLMEDWTPAVDGLRGGAEDLTVAMAYCAVFAKTFGRPPILPKHVPVLNRQDGLYGYKRSV